MQASQPLTTPPLQRFWRYCMHYWGEVQEVQVKGCLPECLLLLRFDAWKLILDVERAGAIKFDTSLPAGSVIRLPNNQTDCVSSLKALLQLGPIPTANETASLRFASGCRKGMNCGQVDWKVIIGPLRRRRVVRTLDPVVGWSVNDDGGSFGKKRGRRTSGDEWRPP